MHAHAPHERRRDLDGYGGLGEHDYRRCVLVVASGMGACTLTAHLYTVPAAERNQVRFGASGGIRMVSNALGMHRNSLKINQVGCRILRNLAAHGA